MEFRRVVALATLVIAAACSGDKKGDGGITVAVIPKGTSHAFWQSIHAGAEKAAQELGVTVAWRGPLREDDRDSQVSEVENAVAPTAIGFTINLCTAAGDNLSLLQPGESRAGCGAIPVTDETLRISPFHRVRWRIGQNTIPALNPPVTIAPATIASSRMSSTPRVSNRSGWFRKSGKWYVKPTAPATT